MSVQQKLGFDHDFDLTGVDTRAQARTRIIVASLVFASGLTAIDWRTMSVWAAVFAVGDLLLWVATSPKNQKCNPLVFRVLRLTATWISTCAWVGAGVLWWFSAGDIGKAAGTALIGGVLVYVVRGCHKSLVQLAVTGGLPAVALLVLPWFEDTWRDRLGLLMCTGFLVSYSLSSAINAVRSYWKLQATTAALIVKQTEAEAASIAKSEFLANMSHEIRTPLNGVLAMAHVLAGAPLPPREKEAADLICTSGKTLERLLSDILDLAKVEAGQLEMELSSFQAGDLVRSIAGLSTTVAEAKGISLALVIDENADRYVAGDEVRVRQVVTNLVMVVQHWLVANVLKFTVAHEASFAFHPGSQPVHAAQEHCDSKWLLKVDLEDFFLRISEGRVAQVFTKLGFQQLLAFELARLVTVLPTASRPATGAALRWKAIPAYQTGSEGFLPQGAPTSPMLSNLAMAETDTALAALAETRGFRYSRYADDLAFSCVDDIGFDAVNAFKREVLALLNGAGFRHNRRKTVIRGPGDRRVVLGMLVDTDRPRLAQAFKNNLRLHLYYLASSKHGPAAHAASRRTSISNIYHHVRGLISWASTVEPAYGDELLKQFNLVDWPPVRPAQATLDLLEEL